MYSPERSGMRAKRQGDMTGFVARAAANRGSQRRRTGPPPTPPVVRSVLQSRHIHQLADDTHLLPQRAYSVAAEPTRDGLHLSDLEIALGRLKPRIGGLVAISKVTVQRARQLLALRHLQTAQIFGTHRQLILQETGWRITPLRPRPPCLRLLNVPEFTTNDEMLEAFFQPHNASLHAFQEARDEIRVFKRRAALAIIEVPPEIYRALPPNRELVMGQRLVTVHDHYNLIQCFKCCGYGHFVNDCPCDLPICAFCAESHRMDQCRNKSNPRAHRCHHCLGSSENAAAANHTALDHRRCPAAQQRQEARKAQTIYDVFAYRELMQLWIAANQRPAPTTDSQGRSTRMQVDHGVGTAATAGSTSIIERSTPHTPAAAELVTNLRPTQQGSNAPAGTAIATPYLVHRAAPAFRTAGSEQRHMQAEDRNAIFRTELEGIAAGLNGSAETLTHADTLEDAAETSNYESGEEAYIPAASRATRTDNIRRRRRRSRSRDDPRAVTRGPTNRLNFTPHARSFSLVHISNMHNTQACR